MANLKGGTRIGGYTAVHTNNIIDIIKARDGHNSGIDADLLDGKHASEFSLTSHNHDSAYVKKSGDTMTGGLTTQGWGTGFKVVKDGGDLSLNVLNNQARIRVGGDGALTNNGFCIQGPGDVNWLRLNSAGDGYLGRGGQIVTRGDYGHNNGIDADMLDGVHRDNFIYGKNGTGVNSVNDINQIWKCGFYEMNGETNAPEPGTSSWWWIVKLGHSSNKGDYKYGTVITGKNGSDNLFFKNATVDGTANWCKIWHNRNDGHTSGMDADTVDGKHWSDLEGAFVKKSGDTMTGALSIKTSGGNTFSLYAGSADHTFMSLYPRANSSTRGGYFGYGDAATTTMTINNEIGSLSLVSNNNRIDMNGISFTRDTTTPTGTNRLNINSYVYATRFYGAVYNDYAEYFEKDKTKEFEPGDLICLDESCDKEIYTKSTKPYSPNVVGVYSDEYAQCIGGKGDGKDEENFIPLGLAGRVRVKVIGRVKKGDLLVSSGKEGYAMSSSKYIPGTIIGKALENKTSIGEGKVRMLINLQ